jgi:hypothetical protein
MGTIFRTELRGTNRYVALRAHLRPPLSCLSVGAPVKVVSWGSEPSAEVGMVDGLRTFEAGCGTVTAVAVGGLPQ